MSEIDILRDRVAALEIETAAYSAIFAAIAGVLGASFLERAAHIAELTGAHPEAGSAVSKRMTEALRVIDDIRVAGEGHPKPTGIV